MARFCRFYGYTPEQYRALNLEDFQALADYMVAELKRQTE